MRTKSKIKNHLTSILTTKHRITKKVTIPKLIIYESANDVTILGMPRELTKHQIDMIMQITNGVDYKLIVQRDSDKHMMMIHKTDRIGF